MSRSNVDEDSEDESEELLDAEETLDRLPSKAEFELGLSPDE